MAEYAKELQILNGRLYMIVSKQGLRITSEETK